jgi:hypothetical protein
VAGLDLVSQLRDGVRGRADPGEAGIDDALREVRILGQEPVARVDGVGAAALGRLEQAVRHQVRLRGRVPAEREGLVGHADVQGVAVRIRVHRDGGDALVAGGADDPDGDLPAVGHQDLRHRTTLPGGGLGVGRAAGIRGDESCEGGLAHGAWTPFSQFGA